MHVRKQRSQCPGSWKGGFRHAGPAIDHLLKAFRPSIFRGPCLQSARMERMEHSDSGIGRYCNAAFRLPSAAQPRPGCDSGWWAHSQRADESLSFSCGEECVVSFLVR